MDLGGVRRRAKEALSPDKAKPSTARQSSPGRPGNHITALRLTGLVLYFFVTGICIHFQQFLGLPLYWYNQDWYYAWQALAKQYFGIVLVTVQEWWCPMRVRITGDKSVKGQIRALRNGRVQLDFPERIIILSNHQTYTDWVFMWWSAFTSRMHGHFYIILKQSLRYIPLLGPGMMFFSFLFLSRHWETDKPRFQHRLRKLKSVHRGPLSGSADLDPMWLLIFPEGTTLSTNGRESSRKWAEKNGIPDLKHTLLPRSRGLQMCLEELEDTIDYVYDCTMAYDGVPPGEYGQDVYTLSRTYLQGRGPPCSNMHWRRFALATIPIHDDRAFDAWLHARWAEKDTLLAHFIQTGQFPLDEEAIVYESPPLSEARETQQANGNNNTTTTTTMQNNGKRGPVYASVKPNGPLEFVTVFSSVLAVPIVWKLTVFLFQILRIVLLIASLGQIRL